MASPGQVRVTFSDDGSYFAYSGASEMNLRTAFSLFEGEVAKARRIVEICDQVTGLEIDQASKTVKLLVKPLAVPPPPQARMAKRSSNGTDLGERMMKRGRSTQSLFTPVVTTPSLPTPTSTTSSNVTNHRQHTKSMADALQQVPQAANWALALSSTDDLGHDQDDHDEQDVEADDGDGEWTMSMSRGDSNTTGSNDGTHVPSGVRQTPENRQRATCLQRIYNILLHIHQHNQSLTPSQPRVQYKENATTYALSDWASTMGDKLNIKVVRPLLHAADLQACNPHGLRKDGFSLRWVQAGDAIFELVQKLILATKTQNPSFYDLHAKRIDEAWGVITED